MEIFYDLENIYESRRSSDRSPMDIYKTIEDKLMVEEESYKRSLCHIAAKYADAESLAYLISEGARPNVLDAYGLTPLHMLAGYTEQRHQYKGADIAKSTELLLAAKVSTLRKGESGNYCYHDAARAANIAFLEVLIKSGVKVDMTDRDGRNAMHVAALYCGHAYQSFKYAAARQEALKKEGRLDQEGSRGNFNNSRGGSDISEYEKTSKKVEDFFNVIKLLLESGIDVEDKDQSGKTPLDYAVDAGVSKVAILLKGEYDESDPQLADKLASGGQTLHQAARNGDDKAVAALIRLGADVQEVLNESPFDGFSPLAVACTNMYPDCVQVLVDNGADVNYKAGEKGRTAIFFMIKWGKSNSDTFKKRLVQKTLNILVKAGLNIDDTIDDDSNTAINLASKRSQHMSFNGETVDSIIFNELIAMGADVNKADINGVTPLMNACIETNEDKAVSLLENGAAVDSVDGNGNTALMTLAMEQRRLPEAKSIAQIMFDFGDVKIDHMNNSGKNALALATESNNEPLVKLILSNM